MKVTIKNLDGSFSEGEITDTKVIEFLSKLFEKYPDTTKPFSKITEGNNND